MIPKYLGGEQWMTNGLYILRGNLSFDTIRDLLLQDEQQRQMNLFSQRLVEYL